MLIGLNSNKISKYNHPQLSYMYIGGVVIFIFHFNLVTHNDKFNCLEFFRVIFLGLVLVDVYLVIPNDRGFVNGSCENDRSSKTHMRESIKNRKE